MRTMMCFTAAVVFTGVCYGEAIWQVRTTDDAGVEVLCRQTPVVTSQYVFWGANWQYAGARFEAGQPEDGARTFVGSVENLGLEIEAVVRSVQRNVLQYTWTIEARRELKGIIGGGVEFRVALESPVLGKDVGQPELLEDKRGWQWNAMRGQVIQVSFDEPLNVYFERGNRGQIRAMFVGMDVAAGVHQVRMAILLPEGAEVVKSAGERYGEADTARWYSDALKHDASPVDLRFLNHRPAGKFGFVEARGEDLVFENGQQARFWGGNLAAYALFADKEQIRVQARRIAALGYNLMRIHHHDSTGWVGRTVIDRSRADSRHFDAEVMDRLDWWIACLKEEGVYVWLDLHVGRLFKEADGIGAGFAEMARRGNANGAEGKGYCYFNDRVEALMKEFNAKYMQHVNAYTGAAYKDEPAIMGVLITNENDLTNHFGNLMLGDKGNPWHNARFEAEVKAFAARHGLDAGKTGQTWLPGPSKLFLADWEYAWNVRMLQHLADVGVRVPAATTQMWGDMGLCGLSPLTAGGIIDVHSYGQEEALSVNPRYEANYMAYIASGQVAGMPLAITEWNVPYPSEDRFTAPLYVASVSALQGWDAPMIYNYSQEGFGRPQRPSTWSTYSDLALTGMMPAAAVLYRQGHVRQAKRAYCVMLDREALYFEGRHVKNTAALRTLVEQSKVSVGLPDTPELAWDRATRVAAGVEVVRDLDRDFIAAGQNFVRSDTGELMRDWVKGYQVIDTAQTQAAHGWIGGERIVMGEVAVQVETAKAAVAVSSLDGAAIGESKRILVTAIARVRPSAGGRMPMLSEPVKGTIRVRARAGLKVHALGGDGADLGLVEAPYDGGRYILRLPAARGTHWWMLTE